MAKEMTHREVFDRILSFQDAPWIPNYELGIWGQNIDLWMAQGCPDQRILTSDWFVGEPYFHMDQRDFAWIHTGLRPEFEYKVLEETDRYLIAEPERHRHQGPEGRHRARLPAVHGRIHVLPRHRPRELAGHEETFRPGRPVAIPAGLVDAHHHLEAPRLSAVPADQRRSTASTRSSAGGRGPRGFPTCSTTSRRWWRR